MKVCRESREKAGLEGGGERKRKEKGGGGCWVVEEQECVHSVWKMVA